MRDPRWKYSDHYIRCAHCKAQIYASTAVKDRNGRYTCKEHKDNRQMGFDYVVPKLKEDPQRLPAWSIQIEPPDEFYSRGNWEDISTNWEAVTVNWEDL